MLHTMVASAPQTLQDHSKRPGEKVLTLFNHGKLGAGMHVPGNKALETMTERIAQGCTTNSCTCIGDNACQPCKSSIAPQG